VQSRLHAPTNLAPVDDASTLARWTMALVEREIPAEVERARFLSRSGLSSAADPDASIPAETAWEVWRELTDAHADEVVGIHFASALPESAIGVVGYLATTSETVLDGLRRVASFYRLVKSPSSMWIEEDDREVRVFDGPPAGSPPWPRHLAEAVVFAYKAFIERVTGRALLPVAVRLQHAAPASAHLVRASFGAAVQFGATHNMIAFDAADVRRRSFRHDPTLHAYLLPVAEQMLHRATAQEDDPTLSMLERAITSSLPSGNVSLERAARSLGVGARTLQRRLRERSLTFQGIVDDVRRRLASRLLEDSSRSLKEITFLLGFSDPRALRRAQRRWRTRRSSSSSSLPALVDD